MPALTTTIKQIPSNSGYFLAKTLGGSFTAITKFIYDPITFTVGSFGVVGIDGTNVYFDTYANADLFLTDPSSYGNSSYSIADNELYRDMGKTYNIYVQQTKSTGGYYYDHIATLTKVQRLSTDGQTTEGVVSAPSVSVNLKYYFTGYVVTWSANSTTAGIPVGVSRIGFN
jgi:hypothetical protein